VLVLKFFLNVSRAEQKRRFVSRVDEPDKQWKFSNADVRERRFWDAYMEAYEDALNETSRPWAPWYAVPADDKSNMRVLVARIVVESLRGLNLEYPRVTDERRAELQQMRRDLLGGDATA
jgi:polyphosphate kinase 2 (PPK2 family)